jgi:hypothetical protein
VNSDANIIVSGGDSSPSIPSEFRALATRLSSAEDRIFPLVMVDADRYQRAVTLIGQLREYMTEHAATIADLEGIHGAAVVTARELASRQALPIGDLDLDTIVDAAMAQRLRVLLVDGAQQRTNNRIEEARAAGLAWVTVAEPDASTLGMSPSQEWVELHIASGARLIRTISMRPDTGEPLFEVSIVATSGEAEVMACADRAHWLSTADRLREQIPQPEATRSTGAESM